MLIHFSSFNCALAIVFAFDLKFRAVLSNMILHVIQWQHKSALKQAFNNSERAFLIFMLLDILPNVFATHIVIRTDDWSKEAHLEMLIKIPFSNDILAVLVDAVNG